MATIGIYDYDYFNYSPVIPNLECAKLLSYYKRKKEITVLTPYLSPLQYTKYFIQKEYEDGIYPSEFFLSNVEYRGKAFSNHYVPLEEDIERSIPDFSPYWKYIDFYGNKDQIKRILNAAHLRLSINEIDIDSFRFDRLIEQKTTGIILHDYNLANIKNAKDFIEDLSLNYRQTLAGKPKPVVIGNKFPIQINNTKQLLEWLKILPMSGIFFLKYNGLMEDECVFDLANENEFTIRQIIYNLTDEIKDDLEFLKSEKIIKLYKQILFLRRQRINFKIEVEESKFKYEEIRILFSLLNCYLKTGKDMAEYSLPHTQTLYKFCSSKSSKHLYGYNKNYKIINIDEMRKCFAFIRIYNYELFNSFYQNDNVIFNKGEFLFD